MPSSISGEIKLISPNLTYKYVVKCREITRRASLNNIEPINRIIGKNETRLPYFCVLRLFRKGKRIVTHVSSVLNTRFLREIFFFHYYFGSTYLLYISSTVNNIPDQSSIMQQIKEKFHLLL